MISHVSTGQIALWYSLMSINNMTGWTEWFTSPNQTLQLMTGLSRQGLDKARNQLSQAKRIEYTKGKSNQAGTYRIIPFPTFDYQKVGTAVDTNVGTLGAHQLSQEGRKSSTLIDLNNTRHNNNDNTREDYSYGSVFKAYESNFVKDRLTEFDVQEFGFLFDDFGGEWLLKAMREAFRQDKRNLAYVKGILDGYKERGGPEVEREKQSGRGDQPRRTQPQQQLDDLRRRREEARKRDQG